VGGGINVEPASGTVEIQKVGGSRTPVIAIRDQSGLHRPYFNRNTLT
jgi:hypothetical protein